MAVKFTDEPNDAVPEAVDPVWALLGAASRPEPDGWFTARTLARCRLAGVRAETRAHSLERVWRWALGAGLAVCAGLAVLVPHHVKPKAPVVAAAPRKGVQEAFAILASMQPEGDSNQAGGSNSWQDSTF